MRLGGEGHVFTTDGVRPCAPACDIVDHRSVRARRGCLHQQWRRRRRRRRRRQDPPAPGHPGDPRRTGLRLRRLELRRHRRRRGHGDLRRPHRQRRQRRHLEDSSQEDGHRCARGHDRDTQPGPGRGRARTSRATVSTSPRASASTAGTTAPSRHASRRRPDHHPGRRAGGTRLGDTNVSLQYLALEGLTPTSAGASTYGIRIISSTVTLDHVIAQADAATDGTDGNRRHERRPRPQRRERAVRYGDRLRERWARRDRCPARRRRWTRRPRCPRVLPVRPAPAAPPGVRAVPRRWICLSSSHASNGFVGEAGAAGTSGAPGSGGPCCRCAGQPDVARRGRRRRHGGRRWRRRWRWRWRCRHHAERVLL